LSTPCKIIIAPLDWGLGHATRCIPLIMNLLENDCEVIIAADGQIRSLLQYEFPQLEFLPLKGYNIQYANQKRWLPLKILLQFPGILISIYKEHQWLKKVVKNFSIDAVISDNRFGMYHSRIPSVYITHQLLIKTGNRFSEYIVRKIHYWFIKKYTQCWVPDFEGATNIAGQLSHPSNIPNNVQYIGCLSRFERNITFETRYDLLVLLSGPEPQRTIFEKLVLSQLKHFTGSVLLIRGQPGENENRVTQDFITGSLQIKNHLTAPELNQAIQEAKMVISRSGYTTVMDLIKLQKKAILVPTPGQTEQEYLAGYLMQQKLFYSVNQHEFLLNEALKMADAFPFIYAEYDMQLYKKAVHQFVQLIANTCKTVDLP
jgi:uncharacterized protein (TIGR00661 family)